MNSSTLSGFDWPRGWALRGASRVFGLGYQLLCQVSPRDVEQEARQAVDCRSRGPQPWTLDLFRKITHAPPPFEFGTWSALPSHGSVLPSAALARHAVPRPT